MVERKRVLMIDDYLPLREACAALLASEFDVVELAGGADTTAALVSILQPDVVVLDIALHGSNGLDVATLLKREFPSLKLIFFTADESADTAVEAFRRGALAYVVKHSACLELASAIRLALENKPYLSHHLRDLVLSRLADQQAESPDTVFPAAMSFSSLRSDTDA